jgi:hypothetical protein
MAPFSTSHGRMIGLVTAIVFLAACGSVSPSTDRISAQDELAQKTTMLWVDEAFDYGKIAEARLRDGRTCMVFDNYNGGGLDGCNRDLLEKIITNQEELIVLQKETNRLLTEQYRANIQAP